MSRGRWLMAVALALVAGCSLSNPPTPSEKGMAFMRTGEYESAIAAFTQAIQINPHDSQSYLFRGRAYQCRGGEGDLNAAIADFTEAIRFNPQDPEAYYSRALAYRDRGKVTNSADDAAKAEQDDEQARQLDPRIATEYAQMRESAPLPPVYVPPTRTPEATLDEAKAKAADAPQADPDESSASLIRRLEQEAAAVESEAAKERAKLDVPSSTGDSQLYRSKMDDERQQSERREANRRRALEEERDSLPNFEDFERSNRRFHTDLPSTLPGGGPAALPGGIPQAGTISDPRTQLPANAPIGAGATRRPQSPAASAAELQSPAPYSSPFPQRRPSPTGYVEPSQVDQALPQQPRTLYPNAVRPRPVNQLPQLPGFRRPDFNP